MRGWVLCLLLALVAGAGLRLHGLGHSLRIDEVEAWAQGQRPLAQILSDEDRLPQLGLLHRLVSATLGDSEFRMRLPHALFGMASLLLIFLLGRTLFDERVGALACLLLGTSVCHIEYSQEARYYAPLLCYALSALCCMTLALKAAAAGAWLRSAACWTGFCASHALALYLHRFALYPLVLCGALLCAVFIDSLRGKGKSAVAPLVCTAVAACLLLLCAQWDNVRDFLLLEMPSPRSIPLQESYLRWHYRPPGSSILWDLLKDYGGGSLLGPLLLGFSLAGTLAAGRTGLRASVCLWGWIIIPIASLYLVSARTHFELRYFIFILPVWLILAASGMQSAADLVAARSGADPPRARRWSWLLVAGGVLALDAGPLAAYYRLPKARMREAFSHIAVQAQPGDAVMFYPAWDALWYGYYPLPEGVRLFHPAMLFPDSPASAPEPLVRRHERLWLAATWTADPHRRREAEALKASVTRYYGLAAETAFRSRDPNDDYRVQLYQRKPGQPEEPVGRGRTPDPADSRPPRAPLQNRKLRLALNLDEAPALMAASGREFFRVLETVALHRGPCGPKADAALSRFCAKGCSALVWSGKGRFGDPRNGPAFAAGDVFQLPAGDGKTPRVHPSEKSLLLLFSAPEGHPAATGPLRRLAALKAAPDADSPAAIPAGGSRLSVRSLRPGGPAAVTRPGQHGQRMVIGVVLRGRIHAEDSRRSCRIDLRTGDLYLHRDGGPLGWSITGRGEVPALELLLTQDLAPEEPR